jgi:large subunit ribosomal protein L13
MRTFVAKPAEAQATRQWWVVDAKNQPLGRVATRVAALLRGKHKPTFTPHVDTGDFVIVVNASDVVVTGAKDTDKKYYTHSGYPGHLKTTTFRNLKAAKPDQPIALAVKGMLPKNVLGRQIIRKLKVYPTAQHPHAAQQPQAFNF